MEDEPPCVMFYALVSDEIQEVIEFFIRHKDAERMLAECLADEPGWETIIRVEAVEFGVSPN